MMLKNVDPLLNADILHALCQMGHGDEIAIVDAHYAGEKTARSTTYGKLLRMESADTARAIQAVLSVTDIDPAVTYPISRMKVDDQPGVFQPECQKESQTVIDKMIGRKVEVPALPRVEYYERSKKWMCRLLKITTSSNSIPGRRS
jgi:L-fucose mutarotase